MGDYATGRAFHPGSMFLGIYKGAFVNCTDCFGENTSKISMQLVYALRKGCLLRSIRYDEVSNGFIELFQFLVEGNVLFFRIYIFQ